MMSFLKSLFGGAAPKAPALSPNQGLEQLEEKADMIRKRIAHIEDQILEQTKIAQANANTNKTRALAALKKKKKLEENLKNAQGTLDNIESQKDMLENASSNASILKTMADTAKIVKQQHENMDITKVEDIVDEIREQKEISEDISNILSQPSSKQVDDDELLKELEGMQSEQNDAKLSQADKETAAALPSVPTTVPTSAEASNSKKAEDELDELKKWASAAQ